MSVTPMSSAAAPAAPGTIMEQVIALGDLSRLSPEQRARYYIEVCRSVGLNPLTRPFDYITLNGKLTLYPTRGAADQLRAIHGITCEIVSREQVGDLYVVHVRVTAPDGRRDEDLGIVSTASLRGEALANAILKAITKAKRRATLSLLGLNMPDETEVETIPAAQPVMVDAETGEILAGPDLPAATGEPEAAGAGEAMPPRGASGGHAAMRALHAAARGKLSHEQLSELARHVYGVPTMKLLTAEQLGAIRAAVEECADQGDAGALLRLAAAVDEAVTPVALHQAGAAIAQVKDELGEGARIRLLRAAYARVREAIEAQPEEQLQAQVEELGETTWAEQAGDGEEETVSWTALWRQTGETLGVRSLAEAARYLGVPERELRGLTPAEVQRRLAER